MKNRGMAYQSVNPYDGAILKTFEELTDAQLEEKLAAAEACFAIWKQRTYAERAVIVAKAAAIMHARIDEFARPMTREMGKRINEARGEVEFSSSKRVASRVDTGMMFINNISWSDAELPFGGIKNSGYGRELGDMGIQEFVNKKLVRTGAIDAPA